MLVLVLYNGNVIFGIIGNGLSVADPGCLSRMRDPNLFHPGSASKDLSILTKKIVSTLSEI
jgi:hypothetical protein